ncbi:uncharacterized protein LOC142317625 [Lycorma delicatula]|uniref:uncharacterized protein LOC142317625 n=1 Tax=Lycorma delicatula TaxID=130591 RepID=UPI003F517EEB
MIRTLLINNHRSILSNDLLEEISTRGNYDFIVATEPHVYSAARLQWVSDTNGDVAIRMGSIRMAIRRVAGNREYGLYRRAVGLVAVELNEIVIIGVYISPNIPLGSFQDKIFQLQRIVMQSHKRVLILGDFNCRTTAAGAASSNAREGILEEFLAITGAVCIYDRMPTFKARGHDSILDLAIIDRRMDPDLTAFTVLSEETGSDHLAVSVVISDHHTGTTQQNITPRLTNRQIQLVVRRSARRIAEQEQINPDMFQEIIVEEIARVPH